MLLGCSASERGGSIAEAPALSRPAPSSSIEVSAAPSEAAPSAAAGAASGDAGPTTSPSSAAPVEAPPPDTRPHITSVGYITWIRKKPEVKKGDFLGYVRVGTSIAVKSLEKISGPGCGGGFFRVEPRGYVCADRTVATDPSGRFIEVAKATRSKGGTFPYRYALSDGTPMYNRIPDEREQQRNERFLGARGKFTPLIKTLRAHEELAVADPIAPDGPVPAFLEHGGATRDPPFDLVAQNIPRGSMLSFSRVFEAEGRTWLLSTDHTIVPADHVRAFRPSAFHGVDLRDGATRLPIAWMRVEARPQWERRGDAMVKTGDAWPVRSFVSLAASKAAVEVGGARYLETTAKGSAGPLYVAEKDATFVDRAVKRPFGIKDGQKWIVVSISNGTLVAYEGDEPVYATLVSPGKGGVPVKGRDPVKDSTTPLGTYTITFKDRAATMSPDSTPDTSADKPEGRTFWIADVPYTQYFNPPFALHAAFWHERFGEPVSAGCVNLSPIDAEAMFAWTDPPVPAEWQGATGAGAAENGASTAVVITR